MEKGEKMKNAELFKKVFGIYAEEFWAYPNEKMLDWLNSDVTGVNGEDLISREDAINLLKKWADGYAYIDTDTALAIRDFRLLHSIPSKIIRCKNCKYWDQATYLGKGLSFGFCECDDMWMSLYGETTEVEHIDTDEDFFCGYAKRKEEK
jgi:hypothetical protein